MAGQDNWLAKRLERAIGAAVRFVRAFLHAAATVARVIWPTARLIARRAFEVLLALVLLFEEWGWQPLAAWLSRLARFPVVARLEAYIAGLPPYGALAVFVTPSLLILPLKLLALYLIATGHGFLAALLFLGAKIAGTAILARLYHLTQPRLMQIGWVARAHDVFMPWKDRMFVAIRVSWAWRYARIVKYRVGQRMRARWLVLRPILLVLREQITAQLKVWLGR